MTRQYILDNQPALLATALQAEPKLASKVDEDGRTPLFWAVSQNSPEMVRECLKYPHDLSAADNAGWTVLHIASALGNPLVLDQLIEGSPLEAKTNGGQTAVQLAVSKQHLETVGRLIAAGANIKSKDKLGKTALQRAASLGSVKMVEKLLDAGAPINATDANGWTALHNAVSEARTEVVALLVKRGGNVDAENEEGLKPVHVAPNLEYAREVDALVKELD